MYEVFLSKKAEKQLDSLQDSIALPIIAAIDKLAENPRPQGFKKLRGRDAYRIRQGSYRVIYEIYDDELLVDVIAIGHRRERYR